MESPSINNTWLRRYTVLASIALLKRIRPRSGVVLMLTDNICVKYGPHVRLAEASAMCFVAQNTSIPVPKVYCSFTSRGWTYIVMERIHGTYLAQGWVQRSEESKAKILSKLKSLLQQLRKLSPPGPGISNVDGGSLYDCRLPGPSLRFGPFEACKTSTSIYAEACTPIQTLIQRSISSSSCKTVFGDHLFSPMKTLAALTFSLKGTRLSGSSTGKLPAGFHLTGNTQRLAM